MRNIICSTEYVYHYMFNLDTDTIDSMLEFGIRPLSYFPESERWQQIQEHMPQMFSWIYDNFAKPVIGKPYSNSGIFVTPIDFYQLEGTFLHDKSRVAIPVERINSQWAAVTYELDGERNSLSFNAKTMRTIADVWREDLVREWFGKDQSKVFYYVPQIVTYQPNGIPITEHDLQYRPA